MDDIIKRMRGEEADLVRKLAAVRQFLSVYGEAPVSGSTTPNRLARSFVDRIDKFGSYGKAVIDAAVALLPADGLRPVPTRELVDHIEFRGVEIRGENKVNALSALLARSSQIKGHGRSGWTLAGETAAETAKETTDAAVRNEIEALNGETASASIVADQGAATPGSAAWVNPNPGWSS